MEKYAKCRNNSRFQKQDCGGLYSWLISFILGFLLDKKIGVNQPKRLENANILVANTPMDTDKIKVSKINEPLKHPKKRQQNFQKKNKLYSPRQIMHYKFEDKMSNK